MHFTFIYPALLCSKFIGDAGGDSGGGGGGDASAAASSAPAPSSFTPSFDGALRADGSFAEGWAAKAFGADYKGPLATARTFGDVNKMLTDAMTAARAKTEGMVRVPGENATAAELAAFRKSLGVPGSADEYGHEVPEGIRPEQLDAGLLNAWKGKLHAAGIPKKQAEGLINDYLREEAGQHQRQHAEFTQALEREKAELAARFPQIDQTIAQVKSLMSRPGVPQSLKNVIAKGAFDPTNQGAFWGADALEALAWAARATGEDATRGGGGGSGGMTISEAQRVMSDRSHPLHERYARGDREVTDRISAAYAGGV